MIVYFLISIVAAIYAAMGVFTVDEFNEFPITSTTIVILIGLLWPFLLLTTIMSFFEDDEYEE